MQRFGPALEDLAEYLKRRADAPDRGQIEGHVAQLRRIVASMN
jgi:hypothetical protein